MVLGSTSVRYEWPGDGPQTNRNETLRGGTTVLLMIQNHVEHKQDAINEVCFTPTYDSPVLRIDRFASDSSLSQTHPGFQNVIADA